MKDAVVLLDVAFGDPVAIARHMVALLRIASRTAVRATTLVQRAVRQRTKEQACRRIQRHLRSMWHRKRRHNKLRRRNGAAVVLQTMVQRVLWQQAYKDSVHELKEAGGVESHTFTAHNDTSSGDKSSDCPLPTLENTEEEADKKVLRRQIDVQKALLWRHAADTGIHCATEAQARTIPKAWSISPLGYDPSLFVDVIDDAETDMDTKWLSHVLLHHFLCSRVIAAKMGDDQPLLHPANVLSLQNVCIQNLRSSNYGMFRCAVKVLGILALITAPKRYRTTGIRPMRALKVRPALRRMHMRHKRVQIHF
jgi:hypothetical protein